MQHFKNTFVINLEYNSGLQVVYQNIHQNLIEKCCKNDTTAQYEVYKLYYKAMYNTSLRIINNRIEAEDIMQEAFLSAFQKISTYKGEVSFGAWLKKIVVNQSLDFLKKRKIDLVSMEERPVEIKEEIEELYLEEQQQEIRKVKETINELPDGYRIILSLYLLEGYDHEEIGEILNISGSTSRSQFTRAKRKLVELLESKKVKI
ncbi:MAG: sigma-70 family RNA polymerase sigma factor [Bacteroidota bacterium]